MRHYLTLLLFTVFFLGEEISGQDLRQAVLDANMELVKSLLESGSDVNRPYENRLTAIYFADKLEVVELLLAHGAKLDLRNSGRIQSPIENAAERFCRCRDEKQCAEWRKIVERLKNVGAEYTIDTAIFMNDIEFVRDALDVDDSWVNQRMEVRSAPLKVAAELD